MLNILIETNVGQQMAGRLIWWMYPNALAYKTICEVKLVPLEDKSLEEEQFEIFSNSF